MIPGGGAGGLGMGTAYTYLTYTAAKAQVALLNIKGNSAVYVNGVLYAGYPYALGYLWLPVPLQKGLNELYVRGGSVTASLLFPQEGVLMNTEDPSLPGIILGADNHALKGAIVVINTTGKEIKGLLFKSHLLGKEQVVPEPPLSTRKLPFVFDASAVTAKGKFDCALTLLEKETVLDTANIAVEAVSTSEQYAVSFTSEIDGSLQYYAVTPRRLL